MPAESSAGPSTREELRMHLAQAATRAENPAAREHVERALALVDAMPPTALAECPACGRVGLPRRIVNHDC